MLGGDGGGQGKTQAGAARPGRDKWFENVGHHFWRDTGPGIADFDKHGFGIGHGTFSKLRSVYRSTRLDPMQLLTSPYGKLARRILDFMIKR